MFDNIFKLFRFKKKVSKDNNKGKNVIRKDGKENILISQIYFIIECLKIRIF